MVLSSIMDKTWTDAKKAAENIARKSSIDLIPFCLSSKNVSYPIPEDLKMALEFEANDKELTETASNYAAIIPCLREFRDIEPRHYWFLMKLLIYLDHHQSMIDMTQYSLYNWKINRSKITKLNLIVHIPGLAEERPSVRPRDLVVISQVGGTNHVVSVVSFVGQKYISTTVNASFLNKFSESQKYNIHFLFPDYCLNCMHFAVERARDFQLLPILFPTARPSEKIQQHQSQSLQWVDQNIKTNPEQKQAVIHILGRTAFPAPYILFGPPGTGKTSTLVEAIGQILKKNPSNRILVCTPSNAAADEISLRLLRNAVDAHDMHRMYSVSRDCNDISSDLKPVSNFADNTALYIPRDVLITKKVVIVTLITCHRLIRYKLRENHFSYVIIDEAGQATEPETLIPITLMSSNDASHKGRLHGQLVIAGDPKQLGPSVQSRLAEPLLGRSMLERLMEWTIYRKNENNKYNPSYVTKLVQNYRCHGAILHVPNVLFYEGELKAHGGSHTERACAWKRLPKSDFPVIFHAVKGKEERISQSPSVFNSKEISVVISYVKELLNSSLGGRPVSQEEIGIVTPYRLQRQKIHQELEKNGWSDVSVGTVETFQGQERDVIITSTVRSVLHEHNGRFHIGFLSNPKRFNVALTRAKALLIVVGNPVVLQVDQYWRTFIRYCYDNGACLGSKVLIDQHMSRNEMRDLMGQRHVPVMSWDPNLPFQIVEEKPTPARTFKLPEKNAARRRRLPRRPSGSIASGSEKCLYIKSDYLEDEESFEDTFGPYSEYVTYDCHPQYAYDEEDEYEVNGLFSNDSGETLGSASGSSETPENPNNAWRTARSPADTDQSDESPDSNEDTTSETLVTSLNGLMSNLKIDKLENGC